MKTLLVLMAILASFIFAFFLAALGGAVVGHFTNPKIGFASLFPLGLVGVLGTQRALMWIDSKM